MRNQLTVVDTRDSSWACELVAWRARDHSRLYNSGSSCSEEPCERHQDLHDHRSALYTSNEKGRPASSTRLGGELWGFAGRSYAGLSECSHRTYRHHSGPLTLASVALQKGMKPRLTALLGWSFHALGVPGFGPNRGVLKEAGLKAAAEAKD